MAAQRTVHVVHCVDTEGPLHESVEATFERLRDIFELDLEPSRDDAAPPAGRRASTWEASRPPCRGWSTRTCSRTTTPGTRSTRCSPSACPRPFATGLRDSRGGGWVYNWFCVDHVDYDVNPRRRDMGYHNVFDHYRARPARDGLGAGRPALPLPPALVPPGGPPLRHALVGVLRQPRIRSCPAASSTGDWFPAANRPGFHVIRPDSHWFLEQYIPFDFSSQAMLPDERRRRPGRPRGRPARRLAPGARRLAAVPPGPRRLPGAGRLPALDRPLPQHRHPVPAARPSATCVRRSRRRGRASRSCWR